MSPHIRKSMLLLNRLAHACIESYTYILILICTRTRKQMARGPKKHLKRLDAPKHWMLDKLGGIWAPRPSTGPHKLRECLPLVVMLRNRLNYALTGHETKMICINRHVAVDGKIRTDPNFPAGFMGEDVEMKCMCV